MLRIMKRGPPYLVLRIALSNINRSSVVTVGEGAA
jgi:hypothetical protein